MPTCGLGLWKIPSDVCAQTVYDAIKSGVRLLDKSAAGRENFFRIEIWTKFSDSQPQILQEMQKHLED